MEIGTGAQRAIFAIRSADKRGRGVELTTIKFIVPTGRVGRLCQPFLYILLLLSVPVVLSHSVSEGDVR